MALRRSGRRALRRRARCWSALYGRERLGGADIELCQVECLFQLGADAIIAEQVLDAAVPRTGHGRTRLPFCAVVPTRGEEGWLAVAAADDAALQALARVTRGLDVHALAAWASTRPAADAAAKLQAAGVPAAPVLPPHALTYDPQLEAAGFWQEMDRPFVGRHLVGASPFRFDGMRPALRLPAPVLGEHTAQVLAELAG